MRKLLAALIVVAFVFSAAPALAQKVKMPKSICFSFAPLPIAMTLAMSNGGKVKIAGNETATFYDIHGSCFIDGFSLPIHGSGYVKNGIFNFTFTGSVFLPGNVATFSGQAGWNLATNTGGGAYSLVAIGSIIGSPFTLTQIDCGTYSIIYDTVSDAGLSEGFLEGLGLIPAE